jgi:soluble lytic murein transglycosylase-like protein
MFIYFLYALLLIGLPLVAAPRQAPSAAVKPEQALAAALQKQRASVQQQWQAVRQQLGQKAGIDTNWVGQFIDPLPAFTPSACPALNNSRVNELVEAAARRQSLDPALLRAVMRQESAFNPCAVSIKGALGLMQLMPATARELHVADVFNPEQNIRAGAAYLKQLLDRYSGDLRLALVGYNAGPGRADQPVGAPYPIETQNYVANILAELGIGPAPPAALNDEGAPSGKIALNNEVVPDVADEENPAADAVTLLGPAVSNPRAGVETTKPLQLTKIRSWPL